MGESCRKRELRNSNFSGEPTYLSSFPKNPARKAEWAKVIQRFDHNTKQIWTPSVHSRLCSEHFSPEHVNYTYATPRLKDDAVPTIFSALPRSLQPVIKPKRKAPAQRVFPLPCPRPIKKKKKSDDDQPKTDDAELAASGQPVNSTTNVVAESPQPPQTIDTTSHLFTALAQGDSYKECSDCRQMKEENVKLRSKCEALERENERLKLQKKAVEHQNQKMTRVTQLHRNSAARR